MRIITLILIALVMVACGSSASGAQNNTPMPTPTPTLPPHLEAALRARVTMAYEELNTSSWLGYYKFIAPSDRADCSSNEYAAAMANGMALVRVFGSIDQDSVITWELKKVKMTSATAGLVWSQILADGEALEYKEEDEGDVWVFEDDDWWWHIEDPCNKVT